jgi:hypothetical protein
MAEGQRYRCEACGHICTEAEMTYEEELPIGNSYDGGYSFHSCPSCRCIHDSLEPGYGWIKVEEPCP